MSGGREATVTARLPEYFDAVERSWQDAARVMKDIQNQFHQLFPWPMKDWQEPAELAVYDPKAPPPDDSQLMAEEVAEKGEYTLHQNKVRHV